MRLIPKKSKVNPTVWLNFTLFDIILAFVLMIIAFLIALSNFEYKWALLLAFVALSIMMFFSDDGERAYMDLIYMLKYAASRKVYEKGKKHGDAADLIPFKKIREDGVIEYDDYYGAILSVGSVEFGLLDEVEQNRRISAFAGAINSLGENAVMQIVKIDRPINYDEVAKQLFVKLELARREYPPDAAKIEILKSRLAQIDSLNNIAKQYRPYYYVVVYESDEDLLLQQVDVMRRGLDKAGLTSYMIEAKEAAVFFKYCYTRNFDEREIDNVDPADYTDYVKPDKVRFNSTSCACDDVYSFTCAISDFPLGVTNAWGAGLFNIDNTKVVLTIKPVEKGKAVKRIDRAGRRTRNPARERQDQRGDLARNARSDYGKSRADDPKRERAAVRLHDHRHGLQQHKRKKLGFPERGAPAHYVGRLQSQLSARSAV